MVDITLVTYNGLRWLPDCLASVESQTHSDFELHVLDNGSTDGSVGWLTERLRALGWAHLELSTENLGFARGHNRLIERSTGRFVLLLNQDAVLDREYLAEALEAFAGRSRIGAVQGRVLRLDGPGVRSGIVDTTGLVMQRDRRVASRDHGQSSASLSRRAGPLFGVDGPVALYRRTTLRDARLPRRGGGWEVLDEDFFMYKEDVDLAWRIRSLGWTAWYEPDAVAWHGRGAGGPVAAGLRDIVRANQAQPRWIRVLSWGNHRLMLVKNETLGAFLRDLPWIARREILSLAYMVLADPRSLGALPRLLRLLPAALRKRRALRRRISSRA